MKNIDEYLEEFKTIEKTKNEYGKFLTVESYDCKLNNGHTITREKILKGNSDGSAAVVLPITSNNKVVLAIEPRVFTKKTVDIGLPAGYIEKGEKPIDAAKRELLEETGYETEKLIFLGSFYQDQGCSEALNHYYIAYKCKKIKKQNLDKDEFIKYIEVSFKELQELIDNGYIKGLNSAYTIEKAKTYLKER